MNLAKQVAAIVRERGEASADTIHIEGRTHAQIVKAMQNAAAQGLVLPIRKRGGGHRKGKRPYVYGPGDGTPQRQAIKAPGKAKLARGEFGIGRVSSVFALGA